MARSSVGLWWPAWWDGSQEVEDPHCTLIYLGKHEEDYGERLRERLRELLEEPKELVWAPTHVDVTGTAIYGPPEEPVRVLTLDRNELLEWIHDEVVELLNDEGIYSASEFPWNPHVTIGESEIVPKQVFLGDLEVW